MCPIVKSILTANIESELPVISQTQTCGRLPNLVLRVSPLLAHSSLAPGGGKRRDPGNEVASFLDGHLLMWREASLKGWDACVEPSLLGELPCIMGYHFGSLSWRSTVINNSQSSNNQVCYKFFNKIAAYLLFIRSKWFISRLYYT